MDNLKLCQISPFKVKKYIKNANSPTFIFRYQSGFNPPSDIPFEDLSKIDSESSHNSQHSLNLNTSTLKGGTIGAKNLKKRIGILGIFSSNKVCCFLVRRSIFPIGDLG
jgi:hypothetical protein